jgi:hypothetical protein
MEVEDQDEWGDFHAEQESEDWAVDDAHDAFAFQAGGSRPSFSPCTTQYLIDTRTSLTRTRWKDAIKGNPRTSFLVKEALEAKERGEELFSSTVIVRKEEKGNRRAKVKAVEKDLDVAKAKGAKEKWAKEKKENRPSIKEAHLSVTFAWK